MKNRGMSLVTLIITIFVLIVLGIITAGFVKSSSNMNLENQQVTNSKQENCNHEWVMTSKYDFLRECYKTISKCSKCGKEV